MAEVLFYHLTRRPLEAAAPEILEKVLARNWRAVVRLGDPARLAALDARLWTFREDAFLPHGAAPDPHAHRQPIWLTCGPENPNGARFLMLAAGAGAAPEELARFDRAAWLFDGADAEALAGARTAWRGVVAAGLKAVYWAEAEQGWVKKAEAGEGANR